MPNWCNNTLTISHPDPAMMEKAAAAWNESKFLATLVPEPDYPGYHDCKVKRIDGEAAMPDWWTWRVNNWGTKWDVGYSTDLDNTAVIVDGVIQVCFDSAWAPPIQAYDSMVEQGFSILAYYYEPGCDFCGRYEDGDDDCYQVSDGDIPKDIDDAMGISDSMQEYEED